MLQEDDEQGGDPGAEDQVTTFLERELQKDPPRLDFEGFQGLVRTFCELAGVQTQQARAHTCARSSRCKAEERAVMGCISQSGRSAMLRFTSDRLTSSCARPLKASVLKRGGSAALADCTVDAQTCGLQLFILKDTYRILDSRSRV